MKLRSDTLAATFVEAWECTGKFNGYVYTQSIAIDKMALGCDVEIVTIIRYDNGDREFIKGAVPAFVKAFREYQRRGYVQLPQ